MVKHINTKVKGPRVSSMSTVYLPAARVSSQTLHAQTMHSHCNKGRGFRELEREGDGGIGPR